MAISARLVWTCVVGCVCLDATFMPCVQGSVERLTQEKVDLEASLEMEEEAFINNLVRQLSGFMQNYQAMDRVRILTRYAYSMCALRCHGLLRASQLVGWTRCTGLRLRRCEQRTGASLDEPTRDFHTCHSAGVRHDNMGSLTSMDCCFSCEPCR